MNRSETALVWILRLAGVVLMTAIFAVVMPHSWMKATNNALGLAPLSDTPLTGYLTRSLSAMYAYHGALIYYFSLDVRRFLPAIRFLVVLGLVFGVAMLVLDIAVGMPLYWILGEGPYVLVMCGLLLWLTKHVRKDDEGIR